MKICSSCGAQIFDDTARFCTECGKPLDTAAPAAPEQPVNPLDTSSPATVDTVATEPAAPASDANALGMDNPPAAPVPPVYNQAPSAPAAAPDAGRNIVAMLDRNVETASAALASPWFIITAISYLLFTIVTFVNIIHTYTGRNYIKLLEQYEGVFKQFGLTINDLAAPFEMYKPVSVATSVILMIPMIFTAVGLVIMMTCGNKKPVPTVGISLAKVQPVFKVVLTSFAIFVTVCLTVCAIIFSASSKKYFDDSFDNSGNSFSYNIPGNISDYGDYGDIGDLGDLDGFNLPGNYGISGVIGAAAGVVAIVFAVCCIITIVILIMMLLYYIGLSKTLTTLKKAGSEGKCPKNRVSVYAAVVNIIAAVYMMIMFIIDLIGLASTPNYISLANNCLGMLFFFTSAIAIFKLRDGLLEIPEVK